METKNLLNQKVKHKKFGLGDIVDAEENHITVSFSIGEKKFAYPMAFENFLCLEDSKLQESAIFDLKAFKEVEEKKKEQMALESKRYITPQTYRRGMATEKIQAVSRQTILERGLQIGDVFNTIFEIINTCFGTKYEGYQRAWFRVNEEYAAWFPKLAIYENGRPHAASDKGWVNVISDDGNTIYESNEINNDIAMEAHSSNKEYFKKRITFSKADGASYRFIGVFVFKEYVEDKGNVYERVEESLDVTGMQV